MTINQASPHGGGDPAGVCQDICYEASKVSVWGLDKKVKATREWCSLFRVLPSPALDTKFLLSARTSIGFLDRENRFTVNRHLSSPAHLCVDRVRSVSRISLPIRQGEHPRCPIASTMASIYFFRSAGGSCCCEPKTWERFPPRPYDAINDRDSKECTDHS